MTYIELSDNQFDNNAIQKFWQELDSSGFKEIKLDIDTTIGSVLAVEVNWASKHNLPAMGVSLHSFEVADRWWNLAESSISDTEYESIVNSEALIYLIDVLKSCPDNIVIVESTVDGQATNKSLKSDAASGAA